MSPHFLNLIAGFEKKRALFGGPLVELRELLAVFAARRHGLPLALARRKSAEAVVGEGEPVAAFGALALVDDVQTNLDRTNAEVAPEWRTTVKGTVLAGVLSWATWNGCKFIDGPLPFKAQRWMEKLHAGQENYLHL